MKTDYNHDAGHNLEGYTPRRIQELACGCITGQFLCPKAERLWGEVNYQYNLLKGQPTSFAGWIDYDKALALYREHRQQV